MLVNRAITIASASVRQVAPYASLEKAFAALASVLAVMLSTGFVSANLKNYTVSDIWSPTSTQMKDFLPKVVVSSQAHTSTVRRLLKKIKVKKILDPRNCHLDISEASVLRKLPNGKLQQAATRLYFIHILRLRPSRLTLSTIWKGNNKIYPRSWESTLDAPIVDRLFQNANIYQHTFIAFPIFNTWCISHHFNALFLYLRYAQPFHSTAWILSRDMRDILLNYQQLNILECCTRLILGVSSRDRIRFKELTDSSSFGTGVYQWNVAGRFQLPLRSEAPQ